MFQLFPKITQIAAIPAILIIALGLTLLFSQSTKTFPEKDISAKLSINGVSLEIEIADTPWERTMGLSGRPSLAENRGMLFLLDSPSRPSFWMKEMSFPIDIIWIDGDKKIAEISPKISPDTFPTAFRPETDVLYVLEVNSGLSEKYGWEEGDQAQF